MTPLKDRGGGPLSTLPAPLKGQRVGGAGLTGDSQRGARGAAWSSSEHLSRRETRGRGREAPLLHTAGNGGNCKVRGTTSISVR